MTSSTPTAASTSSSLNPCYNGNGHDDRTLTAAFGWSNVLILVITEMVMTFNPSTISEMSKVLILVITEMVMTYPMGGLYGGSSVLILVITEMVMTSSTPTAASTSSSLNPCYNGNGHDIIRD